MKKPCLIMFFIVTCIFTFNCEQTQNGQSIEEGRKLFNSQGCGSCHGTTKSVTAYPFQKVRELRGRDWVYRIVQNPIEFAKENKRVQLLFNNTGLMPAYPNLTKPEIDANIFM